MGILKTLGVFLIAAGVCKIILGFCLRRKENHDGE